MEGRSLDWSRVRFLTSVSAADAFPSLGLPHIAVAGHSNVGKSSLLNALFGRKGLVRTSKQPGCTRLLNVFEVAGGCVVVDLPGYGFARAGKQEQRRWRRLIEDYVRGNRELALVLCLLDMRHGPKASDLQLIEWLNAAGIRWLPVATKADKLSGNARAKRLGEMRAALGGMLAPIATSATTGFGIQALRDALVRELHACLAMP
ncbi:MAG: YihA family ribosome biogenesis GTP-binding protein [Zetaproteobacteria bacterium]|nr:MAG: YihA family ribosome biogenesis GTP-binding protein [Zetaproteobacteria bacterium]